MRRRAFLSLLGASPLACSSSSSPTEEPEPDPRLAAVRERLGEAVAEGLSATVLVALDSGERILEGYGQANREEGIANDEVTAFDFGSVMKDMTSVAVYRLQEAGQLDVEAALSDIFPAAPSDKAAITLRQLLQHRSGLRVFHDTMGDFEPLTKEQARAAIFAQTLAFEPGTDVAYSNSGYTLLADVIEETTGATFESHVREAVFTPAGMAASGFFGESLWAPGQVAIGYDASTFGDNDPTTWPHSWALKGNGGLVTTVGDVERWLVALHDGTLLGEEALSVYRQDILDPAMAGGVFTFAGAGDYGLGGVAADEPVAGGRIVIGTNAYEVVDVEELARDLAEVVFS